MMENNFNENLFQAIDTIIAKRLEEVVFDETIQCSIVGKTSTKSNEYEVKNNSVIFKAIAKDGEEYKAGDNVCISILANSNERIILGRYTLEQEDALSYTDPFDKFVTDKEIPLISGGESIAVIDLTNEQEISCEDIELTLRDNQPSSLSGYDFMGLELGINVSGLSVVTEGDWAIGITLLDDKNNPLHDMYKYGPNEEYEISPYVLASDEIYGNPYALTSNFTQRKLFYFPNSLQLSKIHQVKINMYQSGGFTFDDAATLTIENFQIAFGYDVNKYLDKPIHLYVEGEYNGIYTYLDSDHVGMENEFRPDIKTLLIDQKNKKILKELPKDWSIRWYKYKINEPGDEYGGGYWEHFDKVDGLTLPKEEYALDIDRPNTQIKAVLCEDKPSVNLNLKTAEIIVFDDRRDPDAIFDIDDLLEADQGQYIIYNDENGEDRLAKYISENGWSSEAWSALSNEEWLTTHYGDTLGLGTIAAVIHLEKDIDLHSTETPICYYEYMGNSIWQSISLNETEKIVIATSDPFVFENNISSIESDRNTQISIEAERIHWLVYDNGYLTGDNPIRLTVKHNFIKEMTWKPKILNWFLIGEGQIEGISLSDNASEEDIKKQLQVPLGDDGEAPNTTIYCYLKEELTVSAAASINNTIRCVADGIDVAEIQLSFANRSAQGTGYSFIIQPNKNYIVNKVNNDNEEARSCIFTPKLTTSDGIELDISQYNVQWSWDQQNPAAKEHMIIFPEENSKAKVILQETFENDEYNVYIIQASCVVNALQKKGTQDVTETITLIARYPIAITNCSDSESIIVNGIFELQWDNQQNLLTALEDESNEYTIQINDEILEVDWNLYTSNKDFSYVIIDNQLKRKANANDLFTNQHPVCITCTYENGFEKIIVWQQPLVLSISRYDYDLTNKWAGGAVTINGQEATVMATAFGAGTKDTEKNTFTGILMGSFAKNHEYETVNGLYGFNKGISTFGIDAKTGDAYFKGHVDALSGKIGNWLLEDGILKGSLIADEKTYSFMLQVPKEVHDVVLSAKDDSSISSYFKIWANGVVEGSNFLVGSRMRLSEDSMEHIKIYTKNDGTGEKPHWCISTNKWMYGMPEYSTTYNTGIYFREQISDTASYFQCGIKAQDTEEETDVIFYIVTRHLDKTTDHLAVEKSHFTVQKNGAIYTADGITLFRDKNTWTDGNDTWFFKTELRGDKVICTKNYINSSNEVTNKETREKFWWELLK